MIFENIRYMNILQKLSLGVMAFPVMQIAAQQARPNIILIVTDQQNNRTTLSVPTLICIEVLTSRLPI